MAQARQALNSAQSKRAPFTGAMNFVRMEAALDGGSAEHPVNGLAEGMTAGITGTAKWQVLEENSLRPRPPKVRAVVTAIVRIACGGESLETTT